jgi:hypothetical protein
MKLLEIILLGIAVTAGAASLALMLLYDRKSVAEVEVVAPLSNNHSLFASSTASKNMPTFSPFQPHSISPSPTSSISPSPLPTPSSSSTTFSPQPTTTTQWPSIYDDNSPSSTESRPRLFDRFIIIVLENMDYKKVITDPYMKELMAVGVSFSNFSAIRHPSYPNYLAMVGGETFGVTSDRQITIHDRCIADLLEDKDLTWKNYAENYPGNCFLKKRHGKHYRRKHVPFLSFRSIQKSPKRCANVVPADQFYIDALNNQLPNYSFYSPNMENDGHNTNLTFASGFLQYFLPPVLSNPAIMNGTLIEITYDESKRKKDEKNKIFTVLLGPMVRKGLVIDTHYNHYNILREVEKNFKIGNLGKNDKKAGLIKEDWFIVEPSADIF